MPQRHLFARAATLTALVTGLALGTAAPAPAPAFGTEGARESAPLTTAGESETTETTEAPETPKAPENIPGAVPLEQAAVTVGRSQGEATLGFDTLQRAIDYAAAQEAPQRVRLTRSLELAKSLTVPAESSLVLDLAGNSITFTGRFDLRVLGSLEVENSGESEATGYIENYGFVRVGDTRGSVGSLVLSSGVALKATDASILVCHKSALTVDAGASVETVARDWEMWSLGAITSYGEVVVRGGISVDSERTAACGIISLSGSLRVDAGAEIIARSTNSSAIGAQCIDTEFSMSGGKMAAFSASSDGVGVELTNSQVSMTGGRIWGNNYGMDVWVNDGAAADAVKVRIEGGEIVGKQIVGLGLKNTTGDDADAPASKVPFDALISGGHIKGGIVALADDVYPCAAGARVIVEGGTFIGDEASLALDEASVQALALRGGLFYSGVEEYASNASALDAGDGQTGYREVAIGEDDEDYRQGYFGYRVEAYRKGGAVDPAPDDGEDPKPDPPSPETLDPDRGGKAGGGGTSTMRGNLPQTGDSTVVAVTALGCTGAVAIAAALVGSHRRRNRAAKREGEDAVELSASDLAAGVAGGRREPEARGASRKVPKQ